MVGYDTMGTYYVTEVIFRDELHTRGEGPFRVVEVVAKRVVE